MILFQSSLDICHMVLLCVNLGQTSCIKWYLRILELNLRLPLSPDKVSRGLEERPISLLKPMSSGLGPGPFGGNCLC